VIRSFNFIILGFSLVALHWPTDLLSDAKKKAPNQCESLLQTPKEPTQNHHVTKTLQMRIQDWVESLESRPEIKNVPHPFEIAMNDMNKMGEVQKLLEASFAPLRSSKLILAKVLNHQERMSRGELAQHIKEFRQELVKVLNSKSPSPQAIFGAIMALQAIQSLESLTPRKPVKSLEEEKFEVDGEDEESVDEGQDSSGQEAPPQKARLPEQSPDHYEVRNKDVGGETGGSSEPNYAIGTTAPVPMKVLKTASFEVLTDDLQKNYAVRRPRRAKSKLVGDTNAFKKTFLLNEGGASSQLAIPKSYDWEPVAAEYDDYEVIEVVPEEYVVRAKAGRKLSEKVFLFVEPYGSQSLSAEALRFLTGPSGIPQEAWPQHVLSGIERAKRFGGKDPKQRVRYLSEWFQFDGPYLYNTTSGRRKTAYKKRNEELKALLAQGVPKALAFAIVKMFNCDGGALIGATLIRDFLKLPTRLVGGYPVAGSKSIDGENFNVVDINDPGHAWVEVFLDGKWEPFDFTPNKNNPQGQDKKEKLDEAEDPLDRRSEDSENTSSEEQDSGEESDDGQSKGSENQQGQEKASSNEDSSAEAKGSESGSSQQEGGSPRSDKRIKGNSVSADQKPSQTEFKKDKDEKSTNAKSEDAIAAEQNPAENHQSQALGDSESSSTGIDQDSTVADKESTGTEVSRGIAEDSIGASNEKENKEGQARSNNSSHAIRFEDPKELSEVSKDYDSAEGALVRQIVLELLENHQKKVKRGELLAMFDRISEKFTDPVHIKILSPYIARAKAQLLKYFELVYGIADGSVQDMLTLAKNSIYKDPEVSYRALKSIRAYYQLLAELRSLTTEEKNFLSQLDLIIGDFQKQAHPSSHRHELIQRVMKQLPGDVIRKWLTAKYPEAKTLGSQDQNSMFDALIKGDLAGVLQASLIAKHFNFFLATEREFRVRFFKSLLRSEVRKRGSEDLVLAGVNDIARFDRWIPNFDPHPDAATSLLSRLVRDEQYMRWYRQMHEAPGHKDTLERSLQVVFFDISGSMAGAKARIQASAISAIVDKELSKKDHFGKPLNVVVLIPFGDTTYEPVLVETQEQAMVEALKYLNTSTAAGEGTEFQPCFDEFFRFALKYYKNNPGGNNIQQRFKLTRINMTLITDGGASFDREKVTKDLKALPPEMKAFFNLVHFGDEKNRSLEEIMQMTNTENSRSMVTHIDMTAIEKFIHEASNPQIDNEAFAIPANKGLDSQTVSGLSALTLPNTNWYESQRFTEKVRALLAIVSTKNKEVQNPRFVRIIERLISAVHAANLSVEVKLAFFNDVLSNYENWSGTPLNNLTFLEHDFIEQLSQVCHSREPRP